jgi:hypothetical protein
LVVVLPLTGPYGAAFGNFCAGRILDFKSTFIEVWLPKQFVFCQNMDRFISAVAVRVYVYM